MKMRFCVALFSFLICAGPELALAQKNESSGSKKLDLVVKIDIDTIYNQNSRASFPPPVPRSNAAKKKFQWTKTDTVLQASYTTLHILDWGQTLNIARHPNRWSESNLILGRHPSTRRVNVYLAVTLAGYTAVNLLLPKKWRRVSQIIGIGIETYAVTSNFHDGLRPTF